MGEALSSSETVCCSDHRVINVTILRVSEVKTDSANLRSGQTDWKAAVAGPARCLLDVTVQLP